MSHASDEAIPSALIDEALERVLASRGFRGSARKRRFLEFIVEQTLAGHADRIKAYTIAVDVFDRDASFDPLLDPVVRIQAGRIRHCLEQYYVTEGAEDPVRITIPKGSYVPHFDLLRHPSSDALPASAGAVLPALVRVAGPGAEDPASPASPAPSEPPARGWGLRAVKPPIKALIGLTAGAVLLLLAALTFHLVRGVPLARTEPPAPPPAVTATVRGPSLLVVPFANGTGNPSQDIFAEGFTEDLIGALIRFKNLLVFGADTSFRYRSASALHDAEPAVDIDYVLKGSVTQIGEQVQITVTLMSAKDRRYIWSDSFRRDVTPATLIDLRQDIAAQIARALAQPHGVIYSEEARGSAGRPPTALSSYECMLRTRQYWRQLNAALHAQVRTCLEHAIKADPLYADAWAALAMVTVDEARLGFNPSPARPDPITTGLQLAKHAAALGPDTPLPLQALGMAYWLHREPQAGIAAYEQARALNPNDSDILADLGRCYSLIGAWDRGIPLIREAYARNPAQPSWYRIVLALHHYMNGRYDEALVEAKRVNVPESVLPHVALAMIHAEAGHGAEASAEVGEILRIDPRFAEKAIAEFERRNIAPATIARIVDGLRKAGLPIAPQWASTEGRTSPKER
ncbi:hypothetical protein [Azospirillum sp. sgz302134]